MTPTHVDKPKTPLYLSSSIPDGYAIYSGFESEFAEFTHHSEEFGDRVLFSQAHRARKTIKRLIKEHPDKFESERWIVRALDDTQWANDIRWNDEPYGVAWSVKDRIIIQAKMTLSLQESLEDLDKSDWVYSEQLHGWILLGVDSTSDEFREIIEYYEIPCSPGLENSIIGAGHWEDELKRHYDEAIAMGYDVPSIFDTDREYKKHQRQSVVAIAGMGQVLLADQVGLGKGGSFTGSWLSRRQAAINKTANSIANLGPCVVIVTKSMREEIAIEITKWDNNAKVEILTGTKPAPIDDDVDFIVLNIDILSKRLPDILETGEYGPLGMIIDEAHTVKNPGAARTKAAQELSNHIVEQYSEVEENPFIVLASGTPFLNQPAELWSLFCIAHTKDFFISHIQKVVKGIGKTKMKIRTRSGYREIPINEQRIFETRWCGGKYDKYKQWILTGATHAPELNKLLLNKMMIRRKKSDVMHPLPPLTENILNFEPDYNDPLFERYMEMEDEFRDWAIEEAREEARAEGVSIQAAVKIMTKKLDNAEGGMKYSALRQAIAQYKIEPTKDWIRRFMEGDPEIIGEDETRKKLIVFAYHRDIQAQLLNDEELQQYGMVHILSGQKTSEIQEFKRRFQNDPHTRLMICYMGAREGHTLTAAKDILLAELPYVPSWIVQMAGRCWARFSEEYEPHEAYIHYALVKDSIDTIIFQKNRIKKSMFNSIIDGENTEDIESEGDVRTQGDVFLELVARGKQKVTIAS